MSNVTLFPSCESAGIFFILPCTDSFVKVDLRTVSFDIPPQEVKHCSNPSGCSSDSNLWEMLLTEEPWCNSFLRSWPRTRLRSPWTESCTSGSVTPSPLWPTWSTPTSPPACWLRPHSGMSSEPRTWRSSCPTARASLTACRCVCTQQWTRRRCLRLVSRCQGRFSCLPTT